MGNNGSNPTNISTELNKQSTSNANILPGVFFTYLNHLIPLFQKIYIYYSCLELHVQSQPVIQESDLPTQTIPRSIVNNLDGLIVPFNLDITLFPEVTKFLEKNPSLIDAANIMLKPSIAASTMTAYKPVIENYKLFCLDNSYNLCDLTEQQILEFIGVSFSQKPLLSYFNLLLPSISCLEKLVKDSSLNSCITPKIKSIMQSFKRKLSESKKPTKKGTLYKIDNFKPIIDKEILPFQDNPERINSCHFRSVFRAIILYFTFCRFSDFKDLCDQDFIDHGDFIEIVFKKSKNDQYYKGSNSILTVNENSSICPVFLTKLYFKKFGLNFFQAGFERNYVNFRIVNKNSSRRIPKTKLSNSNATKNTKKLLNSYNVNAQKFTEKSMKIAGVTALLDSGESLENVAIAGRWKSSLTPMHYRNTSYNFRKQISKNIPHTNIS